MNDSSISSDYDIAEPDPGALIESLRGFGYSTQTAIADLIDNSIFAKAKNVWLEFLWDGPHSFIAVRDDGYGMSESELVKAMRPGSRNPLEVREPSDLGRFGLGLKTASFSQCRKFTVHTRKSDSHLATRCWDLAEVVKSNQWRLLRSTSPIAEKYAMPVNLSSPGTVVIWEDLDRIVANAKTDDRKAHDRFLNMVEDVEHHLRMVFHRFLARPVRLNIFINNAQLKPWNPFLTDNKATQHLGNETLSYQGQKITVTPYVLPHHTKLNKIDHAAAGGTSGWNASQGFYVYRNERLLVAGDWLGLSLAKEEHYKLARIQVDIPNTMDQEWHIDVRKSKALPPGPLKEDFKRIARMTRERASAVYRHRGKILAYSKSENLLMPWKRELNQGKIHYRVNQEHPLIQEILKVDRPLREMILAFIRLLEETVPVPLIAIDHAEHPEEQAVPFEKVSSTEIQTLVKQSFKALVNSGLSDKAARERLMHMEPFNNYPELISSLDICVEP